MSIIPDEDREKLNSRNAFLFPFSLKAILKAMTTEEQGIVLTAILLYVESGEVTKINPKSFPFVALNQFIEYHDKESQKYLTMCKRNKKIAEEREKNRKHPEYG